MGTSSEFVIYDVPCERSVASLRRNKSSRSTRSRFDAEALSKTDRLRFVGDLVRVPNDRTTEPPDLPRLNRPPRRSSPTARGLLPNIVRSRSVGRLDRSSRLPTGRGRVLFTRRVLTFPTESRTGCAAKIIRSFEPNKICTSEFRRLFAKRSGRGRRCRPGKLRFSRRVSRSRAQTAEGVDAPPDHSAPLKSRERFPRVQRFRGSLIANSIIDRADKARRCSSSGRRVAATFAPRSPNCRNSRN